MVCTKIGRLLRFFYMQEGLGSVLSKLNIASVVNNLIFFCFCFLMSICAPESNFLPCLCIHLCFHPVMVDFIIFLLYSATCALCFISFITVSNSARHKKLLSLLFEFFGISAWSLRDYLGRANRTTLSIFEEVLIHVMEQPTI
jgi:predicted neutral ceramidase superfamily lipid hydrolase